MTNNQRTTGSPPLRYNISSWDQLTGVLSNNSTKLKITITDFIQNTELAGKRITVVHSDFGDLFTCVLNASGSLISPAEEGPVHEFTTTDIINELYKYGFIVSYNPRDHLPQDQLDYLVTLKGLHYDKIRTLSVWKYVYGAKQSKTYVVAFNVDKVSEWINQNYSPNESEFVETLRNGDGINITAISDSRRYNWSWLDYVANIDDILADNGVS